MTGIRIELNVTPKTADELDLVIEAEGVTMSEALRRLVGYGGLIYRTIRQDGGEVLLRHGNDIQRLVLLHDDQGDPAVRAPTVWMRRRRSPVAHAFGLADLGGRGGKVEPLGGCGAISLRLLREGDEAGRCASCERAVEQESAPC